MVWLRAFLKQGRIFSSQTSSGWRASGLKQSSPFCPCDGFDYAGLVSFIGYSRACRCVTSTAPSKQAVLKESYGEGGLWFAVSALLVGAELLEARGSSHWKGP